MYCMYACLCAHTLGARGRTLSNKFIIVGGVARESYGTREASMMIIFGKALHENLELLIIRILHIRDATIYRYIAIS